MERSSHMGETAPIAIMTYNILIGGSHGRLAAIEAVLREHHPDIVGIQEANDPHELRAMADRLGMQCVVGYAPNGFHVALLSRLPIRVWAAHGRPVFQKGLIEAVIDVPGEATPWHIFCTHLTADFMRGWKAERRRAAEARACIEAAAQARRSGRPVVLLGDMNAIAPDEGIAVIELLARAIEIDDERHRTGANLYGHAHLQGIVPRPLHPLLGIIRRTPTTPALAAAMAFAGDLLMPRWAVREFLAAGYVDCLRASAGSRPVPPTCPLPRPAGRIDYIWADPITAQRLLSCSVISDGSVPIASDHRPVLARFAAAAQRGPIPEEAIALQQT
jgi:endonuclease/exonuclease/phosphatase family metal-dependent hydrolase